MNEYRSDDDQAVLSCNAFGCRKNIALATEHVTLLLRCIFFVALFFLRSILSKFPIGCSQGPIPVPRVYFTVAGSAIVFYLSVLDLTPCLFPFDPMSLQIIWFLIGHFLLLISRCILSIVHCLLFAVIPLLHNITAGSSSTWLQLAG